MKDSTKALHLGYLKDINRTMSVPLHQTVSYEFENSDSIAELFQMKKLGNIYTRLTNPTVQTFENKITALEKGESSVATASGMSAIFYTIINVAKQGDNIIVAKQINGGTKTLTEHTLKDFGIKTQVFDINNPKELKNLIDKRTKLILFESISNPTMNIADFNKINLIANKYGVLTCADNTIATPILVKPLVLGCDLVVHSASKYMTSKGTSIGGIIIERKNLILKIKNNNRYKKFNEPDLSYDGFIYTNSSYPIFTHKLRFTLLRDIGSSLSPFNAWLFIQEIGTLSIRIKKQSKNALKIAHFLEKHEKVKNVNYAAIKSNANYKIYKKYFKSGCGTVLSFDVGSLKFAEFIVNNIKIFTHSVSLGNSLSIITHPASTTHQQLSLEELNNSGIYPGLLRISIGLENTKDLINALKKVLK